MRKGKEESDAPASRCLILACGASRCRTVTIRTHSALIFSIFLHSHHTEKILGKWKSQRVHHLYTLNSNREMCSRRNSV